MRRNATTGWLRFLATALTALLAGAAAAPSSARASCGDYVTVSNPQGQPSHQPPAKPHAVTPCSQHTPGDPTPPCQRPCEGPGCSGDPKPAPAPVSAAGPGGSRDHQDCLLTGIVLGRAEGSAPHPADRAARPVRHAQAVFHPPRTV